VDVSERTGLSTTLLSMMERDYQPSAFSAIKWLAAFKLVNRKAEFFPGLFT